MALGSGQYVVSLSTRDGHMVWQSVDDVISVSWSREAMETSKATADVVLPPRLADTVEPWLHLLSVWRDGELVWHGVVLRVRVQRNVVTLEASDGTALFDYRRIPSSRLWNQHDATQVMADTVRHGLGFRDDTGLVDGMVTRSSRLWVTAEHDAGIDMVSSAIADCEDVGLWWTVSAGRLLVGPVAAAVTLPQLTDDHLDGDFAVVKDGDGVSTDTLVVGKRSTGQWQLQDGPLGLLQAVVKADQDLDADVLKDQAKRHVEAASMPARRVEVNGSAALLESAPVEVRQLVPGVLVPVASSQVGVLASSLLQLTRVEVSVDESGESVQISLDEPAEGHNPDVLPETPPGGRVSASQVSAEEFPDDDGGRDGDTSMAPPA